MMLRRLSRALRRYQRRRLIDRMRGHLEFFGVDLSGMTRAQAYRHMLRSTRRLARISARAMLTAAEAAEAFGHLSRAARAAGNNADSPIFSHNAPDIPQRGSDA